MFAKLSLFIIIFFMCVSAILRVIVIPTPIACHIVGALFVESSGLSLDADLLIGELFMGFVLYFVIWISTKG